MTCDQDLKVERIKASYSYAAKKLEGSIQWEYLCHTTRKFYLYRNEITGTVSLDLLPSQLTEFDVTYNAFSEIGFNAFACSYGSTFLIQKHVSETCGSYPSAFDFDKFA